MKRTVSWLLAGAALAGGCASAGGDLFPRSRTSVIELTATVTDAEGSARVRLLAQRRTVEEGGEVKETGLVEAPEFYQEIFARIDKALFLERQGL